jgi:hypothetical protein
VLLLECSANKPTKESTVDKLKFLYSSGKVTLVILHNGKQVASYTLKKKDAPNLVRAAAALLTVWC